MTLRQYLKDASIPQAQFARSLGVTPETIRRYLAGERKPDQTRLLKIAELTGGKVTANDFFGIEVAA